MPLLDPARRARSLNDRKQGAGPVILWISRDQRVSDNWALLLAAELAAQRGATLQIMFCLHPRLGQASLRHYRFMIDGLKAIEQEARSLGIEMHLLQGDPVTEVPAFCARIGAGALVCDFSPLGPARRRRAAVASTLDVSLIEVDTHNVVPAWIASDKREYAAHTMRKRLERLLDDWLTDIPPAAAAAIPFEAPSIDWNAAIDGIAAPDIGPPLSTASGEQAAQAAMHAFLADGLGLYGASRNDPNAQAQSELSPYLHFGQLSPQRVAFEVRKVMDRPGASEFFDELVTWREVAENQCLHNPRYARFEGLNDWARATLDEHRDDDREFLYTYDQFEQAQTHDELWNAAQLEMVHTGRMHGYMRMYWAKKILEWSPSPEQAIEWAIRLNDRFELDGRDPNGYAGVAWAIGGTLDRPWSERAVYGKIRYMNANGARRKFDVDSYINRIYALANRESEPNALF